MGAGAAVLQGQTPERVSAVNRGIQVPSRITNSVLYRNGIITTLPSCGTPIRKLTAANLDELNEHLPVERFNNIRNKIRFLLGPPPPIIPPVPKSWGGVARGRSRSPRWQPLLAVSDDGAEDS
jgi:hypothetical protein